MLPNDPRTTFRQVIAGIIDGGDCPSDTGLDQQTVDILRLLARQPGKKSPADIEACWIEFARMLDGTHARENDEEWAALIAAHNERFPAT